MRPEEGPAPGVDQSYAFTGHFALNADLRVPDRLTRQIEEITVNFILDNAIPRKDTRESVLR